MTPVMCRRTNGELLRFKLLIAFSMSLLLSMALACNLGTAPPIPTPTATLPPDALTFEQVIGQAIKQAGADDAFSATITQRQFSDWLAIKAPAYAQSQQQAWPFKDTQIAFSDGKVTLNATVVASGWPESPVQLTLSPGIDSNGGFMITVVGAQMGILGVPGPLLSRITQVVQDAVNGQLTPIQGKYKLTKITVSNGTANVSGYVLH
ncbi:MAG: hypothetical protein ACYDBJ_27495 [Aggregatilineales bacterium]